VHTYGCASAFRWCLVRLSDTDIRRHRKSIPPAYHKRKNRPPGVRTSNSKSLMEALWRTAECRQHKQNAPKSSYKMHQLLLEMEATVMFVYFR